MVIEVDILEVILYAIGMFASCAFGMILESLIEMHQKDGK